MHLRDRICEDESRNNIQNSLLEEKMKRSTKDRGCWRPEVVPFSKTNLIASLREIWVLSS